MINAYMYLPFMMFPNSDERREVISVSLQMNLTVKEEMVIDQGVEKELAIVQQKDVDHTITQVAEFECVER